MRNVDEGFDVVDHHADINRDARGRNQAAGDFIDQIVFIARRIIIAEQMDADFGAPAGCGGGLDGVFFFGFDADDDVFRADGLGGQLHAFHQRGGLFLHEHGVLVEQRFAFRAVGDEGVGPGGEFDVRGKPTAARADHAGLPDFVRSIHQSLNHRIIR